MNTIIYIIIFLRSNVRFYYNQYENIVNFDFAQNFETNLERFLQLNSLTYSKQINTIRIYLENYELIVPINPNGFAEIGNMNYVYEYLGLNFLCQGQSISLETGTYQYNFYYGHFDFIPLNVPVLIGVVTPFLENKIPLSQQEIMKFNQDLSYILNNFIIFPITMDNILYSPTYDKYMILGMENISIKPNYIEYHLDNLFNNTSCYSYLGNNIENINDIMLLKQGGF